MKKYLFLILVTIVLFCTVFFKPLSQLISQVIANYSFSGIYAKLKEEFPDARLVIVTDQQDTSPIIYASHPLKNKGEPPIYYASTIKPIYAAVVAERATALRIDPDEPVIPLVLTRHFALEMYADLIKKPPENTTQKYPFIKDMVTPHLKMTELQPLITALQERQDTKKQSEVATISKAYEKIEDPHTQRVGKALLIGFIAALSDTKLKEEMEIDEDAFFAETEPIATVSLGEIIHAAVGPSSNYAVERMKNFLEEHLPKETDTAANYVQKRIDSTLDQNASLTMNGSSKEKNTGLWNAGKLSEILRVFQSILDKSPDWQIGEAYHTLMIEAMQTEEFDDNALVQKYFSKEMQTKELPISKTGYFFDLDLKPDKLNSMPQLVKDNGWDKNKEKFITYIVTMERYKNTDYALAIGIPHNDKDEAKLKKQKETAVRIVFSEMAKQIERKGGAGFLPSQE